MNGEALVVDSWRVPRTVLAWIVGGVFIYAAAVKIADPAAFATDIKRYQLVKTEYINAIALILPWWEMSAGIAMLTMSWRRVGAQIVLVLLLAFLVAIASALYRGLDISCGCFGGNRKAGISTLLFDVGLLLATAAVLWYRARPGLDSTPLADESVTPGPLAYSAGQSSQSSFHQSASSSSQSS